MGTKQTINVAKDFSTEPYGRYPTDGEDSGARFRDEWLLPSLQKFDVVRVELDGTEGYMSSFLDEAFGGLVRLQHFSKEKLLAKLTFISEEDPSLVSEIAGYINCAKPGSK